MSKRMIREIPHDEWVEKQKELQLRQVEWDKLQREKAKESGKRPNFSGGPRNYQDPETGKASRWLQCKTFSNYDETRFGPDDVDQVIDRLGIFENLEFVDDIKYGEEANFGATTLIDRTGTPEYRDKESTHYPVTMVNDAAKIGVDLDNTPMFDGSLVKEDSSCRRISNFVGLYYDTADAGAKREYGYESFHMQRPGQFLMYHHDLYYAVIRDADPELAWKPEKLRRFVIFMEDWIPGHVWIAGNTTYSHWRKGECITWNWVDMPHGTANLSFKTRYSVHLTGYMTDQSVDFYNKGNKDMRYVWNGSKFDAYQQNSDGSRTLIYSR
jgi:hypothetical protein